MQVGNCFSPAQFSKAVEKQPSQRSWLIAKSFAGAPACTPLETVGSRFTPVSRVFRACALLYSSIAVAPYQKTKPHPLFMSFSFSMRCPQTTIHVPAIPRLPARSPSVDDRAGGPIATSPRPCSEGSLPSPLSCVSCARHHPLAHTCRFDCLAETTPLALHRFDEEDGCRLCLLLLEALSSECSVCTD